MEGMKIWVLKWGCVFGLLIATVSAVGQSLTSERPGKSFFDLRQASIVVDDADYQVVRHAARLLQQDIDMVIGAKLPIVHALPNNGKPVLLIGSADKSALWKPVNNAKINAALANLKHIWEGYELIGISGNSALPQALVIVGADRRGTAYGVFELSRQLGVSPWYWWADVVPVPKANVYINSTVHIKEAPKVKYRGIFINDEAPALSGWSKEKFGGFNARFYEKVFELILRHKANYIWPAMWGNAFYDDDSTSIHMADDYAIVIGTSHHEPLMRAHDEWRRYGQKTAWNYQTNKERLQQFWKEGMLRAWNEKIVTVGMRGDGDEPMSRETATSLLEQIVTDQRTIIEQTTQKPAAETPQLWALYKEVQDYYDKGMRVPDDVTLLLCDDNWGNIRRLPAINDPARKGGYGIYYHFDYVGGPRNYKWVNTNHISRIWEQMHLAWQYNARQIWIVNVGDIKPMEFPISFFLDYAWNPEAITHTSLNAYTQQWCARQFGTLVAAQAAQLLDGYTKMNSLRTPELLNDATFNLQAGEWEERVQRYRNLRTQARALAPKISTRLWPAYYQIIQHPIEACANLYEMYYALALNKYYARYNDTAANQYATLVSQHYLEDSLITLRYHGLLDGKWNHMMSQTHIGYTYWQQPPVNVMPKTTTVATAQHAQAPSLHYPVVTPVKNAGGKTVATQNTAYTQQQKLVSIPACAYTRMYSPTSVKWEVLPGHGRVGHGITTWPVTHPVFEAEKAPWLEYDIFCKDTGNALLTLEYSPTLNLWQFEGGMQAEVLLNDHWKERVAINADENKTRTWENWVANHIIRKEVPITIKVPGWQRLRIRHLHPAMVLQHLQINFADKINTYLPAPATYYQP